MGQDFYQEMEVLTKSDKIPMGVGSNCHIEQAILDRNCCIGDNVQIIGADHLEDTENALYCIKEGIIVVRKGAVIPHGTKIGAVES